VSLKSSDYNPRPNRHTVNAGAQACIYQQACIAPSISPNTGKSQLQVRTVQKHLQLCVAELGIRVNSATVYTTKFTVLPMSMYLARGMPPSVFNSAISKSAGGYKYKHVCLRTSVYVIVLAIE